jgi:hypothetical protein
MDAIMKRATRSNSHDLVVAGIILVVVAFLLKKRVFLLLMSLLLQLIQYLMILCLNMDYSVFLRLSRRLAPGLLILFPCRDHVTPARTARVHVPAAHSAGKNEGSRRDHVAPARTARVHVPAAHSAGNTEGSRLTPAIVPGNLFYL